MSSCHVMLSCHGFCFMEEKNERNIQDNDLITDFHCKDI